MTRHTIATSTLLTVLVLATLTMTTGPALAQGNPPGCSQVTGVALNSDSTTPIVVGQEIFYTVVAAVFDPTGCYTSGGMLVITFPDGTEIKVAGFGPETPDYPVIPMVQFGVPFTVTLNTPYVVDSDDADPPNTPGGLLWAEANWYGAIVETATPTNNNDSYQLGLPLGLPAVSVEATSNITSFCEGDDTSVTYASSVTNPNNVRLINVSVDDPHCQPIFVGGDADGDDVLDPDEAFLDLNMNGMFDSGEPYADDNANGSWDPAEIWTYDCVTTISTTTTNTVTVTAEDVIVGMTVADTADQTITASSTGECAGPGDTNGDGVVDVDDIVNVILDFGCTLGPLCPNGGDADGNGIVDVDDIVFIVLNWSI